MGLADTINAIMGAFGNGFTAFVFPAAYHMWVYRKAEARAACLKPPPKVRLSLPARVTSHQRGSCRLALGYHLGFTSGARLLLGATLWHGICAAVSTV